MTQLFVPGSIPIFLNGIGGGSGVKPEAPLKSFDVFYTSPIVVGFHVVNPEAPIASFHVVPGEECDDDH